MIFLVYLPVSSYLIFCFCLAPGYDDDDDDDDDDDPVLCVWISVVF